MTNQTPNAAHGRHVATVIQAKRRTVTLSHSAETADVAEAEKDGPLCFGTAETEAPGSTESEEVEGVDELSNEATDARTRDEGSFLKRALAERNFSQDVARADAEAVKVAEVFQNRRNAVIGALAASYPVYLHLVADEDGYDELVAHSYYQAQRAARERAPSRNKPAILAVQFVTRPQDEAERKKCSEYAYFLEFAEAKQIAPCDFAEDISQVSFKEAKAFVRKERQKVRSGDTGKAGAEPAHDNEKSALESTDIPAASPDIEEARQPSFRIELRAQGEAGTSITIPLEPSLFVDLRQYMDVHGRSEPLKDLLLALSAVAEKAEGIGR